METLRKFYTVDGELVVNLIKHAQECLSKWPNAEVHIGTDSQNKRRFSKFCTVLAFRYGHRGVHYMYSPRRFKKIRDIHTRLIKETEESIEFALWFRSRINVDIEIDLDYNSSDSYLSNQVADGMAGWVTGSGFKANLKPIKQIATKAADNHCR